ncbi:hypothetical protein GCM10022280_04950 [Sphingomonas swuensis]|uniref:Uncharacterized protein n=2 Tax=Sphingomonas swuensis TaxID=977800 RepID=A0ABP7SEQ0_9SPHN
MRHFLLVLPILLASACSGDEKVSSNAATPSLEVMTEQPGDWSELDRMVGRTPFESGLLDESPVTVDINSVLGPEASRFRDAMADAGPLTRRDDLLVATSKSGKAWLVLQPGEHAFRAALRTGQGWREWSTPGTNVPSLGRN